MILKKFRFKLIVQVCLLILLIFLFVYLLNYTIHYATIFILGVIIIIQTAALIRYVEKTNKHLIRFFEAIKYSDFSQSFTIEGLGSSFDELKSSFADVIKAFQKSRAEKEEHFRYLQTVIQHVGIGLIAFEKDGEVKLINSAAKKLLGINQLKNIKSLRTMSEELVDKLFQIKTGERALVKVFENDELLQLVIYATEFKMRTEQILLVSIQNIQGELEEIEMEAWQKLIRVLTHEIMNSIAPISSLASTANELLADCTIEKEENKISNETIDDIQKAVQTIHKRSEGLLHFVQAYRSLTKLPIPSFKIFRITELFDRVEQLVIDKMKKRQINFSHDIQPYSLELTADPELIEQVLINLILNAIAAVKDNLNPKIQMKARIGERGRTLIEVIDNGVGIPKDVQEKIFIPFFTTKKGGSGIGLSLTRQIMRLHKGIIILNSEPEKFTEFVLIF